MTLVKLAVCAFAAASLAACGMMPGSGAKSMDLTLTGSEEVPPVSTSATGSGNIRVGADGAVSGSVTTRGMQGTAAHIHQGPKGQNGPVIVPLTKNGDTYSVPTGAKLNDAQMAAYKAGNLYVNVHSPQHKGGELRAQLRP
jgi:hypothetical protein